MFGALTLVYSVLAVVDRSQSRDASDKEKVVESEKEKVPTPVPSEPNLQPVITSTTSPTPAPSISVPSESAEDPCKTQRPTATAVIASQPTAPGGVLMTSENAQTPNEVQLQPPTDALDPQPTPPGDVSAPVPAVPTIPPPTDATDLNPTPLDGASTPLPAVSPAIDPIPVEPGTVVTSDIGAPSAIQPDDLPDDVMSGGEKGYDGSKTEKNGGYEKTGNDVSFCSFFLGKREGAGCPLRV